MNRCGGCDRLEGHAVLLVADLAGLAMTTPGSAPGRVRGRLRRSDVTELAAEAEQDLVARGYLLLDRFGAVPRRRSCSSLTRLLLRHLRKKA
nr:polyprenyl synthetase [Streptomyces brasiliscabiei]